MTGVSPRPARVLAAGRLGSRVTNRSEDGARPFARRPRTARTPVPPLQPTQRTSRAATDGMSASSRRTHGDIDAERRLRMKAPLFVAVSGPAKPECSGAC